jgi:hypothetical protein
MTESAETSTVTSQATRGAARRKFFREVGSVVLGVLIALAIGEVAELVRWQVRAASSNAAIDVELSHVSGVLDERVLVQPCLDRRLSTLDRIIRASRQSGRLPVIGEIGRPPTRPIQSAAWDDALGSGTLLHLSPERRLGLSLNYPEIQQYSDRIREEQDLWAALRLIEGAPGPASDDLLIEAAVTISRLRYMSEMNGVVAEQVRDSIAAAGIKPSYFNILDREGKRSEIENNVQDRAACKALTVQDIEQGG